MPDDEHPTEVPPPGVDLLEADDPSDLAKIYLLPNLMTAGNLFCGFGAVIRCIQALFSTQSDVEVELFETAARSPVELYEHAVWFILAAVLFDSLDGRMARLTNKESPFGREFDSLADVVSFGMAPALLIYFFLLNPGQEFPLIRTLGAIVGFVYLLCAAVRLARFNVLALLPKGEKGSDDFLGLPVPAAAGMVASLVLVVNREQQEFPLAALFLPILLVIISLLMVSNLRYPSFKSMAAARLGFRSFILLFVVAVSIYYFHYVAVATAFLGYILFGALRGLPWRRGRAQPVGE